MNPTSDTNPIIKLVELFGTQTDGMTEGLSEDVRKFKDSEGVATLVRKVNELPETKRGKLNGLITQLYAMDESMGNFFTNKTKGTPKPTIDKFKLTLFKIQKNVILSYVKTNVSDCKQTINEFLDLTNNKIDMVNQILAAGLDDHINTTLEQQVTDYASNINETTDGTIGEKLKVLGTIIKSVVSGLTPGLRGGSHYKYIKNIKGGGLSKEDQEKLSESIKETITTIQEPDNTIASVKNKIIAMLGTFKLHIDKYLEVYPAKKDDLSQFKEDIGCYKENINSFNDSSDISTQKTYLRIISDCLLELIKISNILNEIRNEPPPSTVNNLSTPSEPTTRSAGDLITNIERIQQSSSASNSKKYFKIPNYSKLNNILVGGNSEVNKILKYLFELRKQYEDLFNSEICKLIFNLLYNHASGDKTLSSRLIPFIDLIVVNQSDYELFIQLLNLSENLSRDTRIYGAYKSESVGIICGYAILNAICNSLLINDLCLINFILKTQSNFDLFLKLYSFLYKNITALQKFVNSIRKNELSTHSTFSVGTIIISLNKLDKGYSLRSSTINTPYHSYKFDNLLLYQESNFNSHGFKFIKDNISTRNIFIISNIQKNIDDRFKYLFGTTNASLLILLNSLQPQFTKMTLAITSVNRNVPCYNITTQTLNFTYSKPNWILPLLSNKDLSTYMREIYSGPNVDRILSFKLNNDSVQTSQLTICDLQSDKFDCLDSDLSEMVPELINNIIQQLSVPVTTFDGNCEMVQVQPKNTTTELKHNLLSILTSSMVTNSTGLQPLIILWSVIDHTKETEYKDISIASNYKINIAQQVCGKYITEQPGFDKTAQEELKVGIINSAIDNINRMSDEKEHIPQIRISDDTTGLDNMLRKIGEANMSTVDGILSSTSKLSEIHVSPK